MGVLWLEQVDWVELDVEQAVKAKKTRTKHHHAEDTPSVAAGAHGMSSTPWPLHGAAARAVTSLLTSTPTPCIFWVVEILVAPARCGSNSVRIECSLDTVDT